MSVRFRSVLHRVLNSESMNDTIHHFKDDSRPAFQRPQYIHHARSTNKYVDTMGDTVGLYIDAIDARPDKNTSVGSHHAFMMDVSDRMLDYFKTLDLSVVKGGLLARRCGEGVVLEGFRSGCILVATFDSPESLDSLWTLHIKGSLTSKLQDILVDRSLLKATSTSKLTIRAKMWEDEYKACKNELQCRTTVRLKLSSFENDLKMVRSIKDSQHRMPEMISKAREHESDFEHNLGEFMLTVKRAVPHNTTAIRNLKEFTTNMRVAKGVKKTGFETVDQYLRAVEFFRQAFADIEKTIINPLCQVRAACEDEKQQGLKKLIRDSWAEMTSLLKPENDLSQARFKDWEMKVLKREHGLFFGLISLIPLCLDRLTTIDVSADEYVTDFPEMVE